MIKAIFSITCFVSLMVLVGCDRFSTATPYILVIQETHNILYDETAHIPVTLFTNIEIDDLFNETTYGFFHNKDETYKAMFDQFDVYLLHQEYFRDEKLQGYKIDITLPQIEDTYYIDEFYMTFYTDVFQQTYHLGELFVRFYLDVKSDLISWYALEGLKYDDSPQLRQIIIEFHHIENLIDVKIGHITSEFYFTEQILVIQIPQTRFYFNKAFVELIFDSGVSFLPYFEYFKNYQLISSGMYQMYVKNN